MEFSPSNKAGVAYFFRPKSAIKCLHRRRHCGNQQAQLNLRGDTDFIASVLHSRLILDAYRWPRRQGDRGHVTQYILGGYTLFGLFSSLSILAE